MKLQTERQLELQSFEGLTGAPGSTSMLAKGHQSAADYWQEDSVPYHMYLSIQLLECPHNTVTDFPQLVQDRQQRGSHVPFYDLVSDDTTSLLPHSID